MSTKLKNNIILAGNVGRKMIHKSSSYIPPKFNQTDNENNSIRDAVRGMSVPNIIQSFQSGLPCLAGNLAKLPIVKYGRDMIASTQRISEKIVSIQILSVKCIYVVGILYIIIYVIIFVFVLFIRQHLFYQYLTL